MLVVNLYGGPGSGKSTTAAGVFSELKQMGINAELVTEYAKDKAWEFPPIEDKEGVINFAPIFDNQIYIFAKQHHRMWRLKGKVQVAITDSPLILSAVYNAGKFPALDALVFETYASFNNLDIYLNRVKKYNPAGRNQDETQARLIDNLVKATLIRNNIDTLTLNGDRSAIELVVENVSNRLLKMGF